MQTLDGPPPLEGGQHSIDIARKRPPGKALEKIVAKGLINKAIRTFEFEHSRMFDRRFHRRFLREAKGGSSGGFQWQKAGGSGGRGLNAEG